MVPDAEWTVFFADDDEDDAFLFEMAVEITHRDCLVRRFTNFVTLFDALGKTNLTTSIVFLDLKMHPVSGMDLLIKIRQSPIYSTMMVFMLSGCHDPKVVWSAYQNQVNSFLFKPTSHDEWLQVLSHAIRFAKNS